MAGYRSQEEFSVLIRDTTDREHGPVLRLTREAFFDFTTRIRRDAAL